VISYVLNLFVVIVVAVVQAERHFKAQKDINIWRRIWRY